MWTRMGHSDGVWRRPGLISMNKFFHGIEPSSRYEQNATKVDWQRF